VPEPPPSLCRFVGRDVAPVALSYAHLGFASRPGGVVDDRLRRRDIRGARIEYARYAPVLLPGADGWERRPIRGWHFYAGAVDDRELWGLHTVVERDVYGGTRFGGSGRFDLTVQGGYSFTNTQKVNPNNLDAV